MWFKKKKVHKVNNSFFCHRIQPRNVLTDRWVNLSGTTSGSLHLHVSFFFNVCEKKSFSKQNKKQLTLEDVSSLGSIPTATSAPPTVYNTPQFAPPPAAASAPLMPFPQQVTAPQPQPTQVYIPQPQVQVQPAQVYVPQVQPGQYYDPRLGHFSRTKFYVSNFKIN